jgi:hypothetical protein
MPLLSTRPPSSILHLRPALAPSGHEQDDPNIVLFFMRAQPKGPEQRLTPFL